MRRIVLDNAASCLYFLKRFEEGILRNARVGAKEKVSRQPPHRAAGAAGEHWDMAEGLAGEGGEDRAVLAGRPRVQRRSPAEALQAVLMLLNWQVQLVQDALAMLRAPAGQRPSGSKGFSRNAVSSGSDAASARGRRKRPGGRKRKSMN